MPVIKYIDAQDQMTELGIENGWSVMEGAIHNDLEGIVAECGGGMSCATCHVYVDPDWQDKLPEPDSTELDMLEFTAAERKPNSRLSCQLEVTDGLDGLIIRMPEFQY